MTTYLSLQQGHSGLADRLLDLYISLTYVRLHNDENDVYFLWKIDEPHCLYDIRDYITIPGCTFIKEIKEDMVSIQLKSHGSGNNHPGIIADFDTKKVTNLYSQVIKSTIFNDRINVNIPENIERCVGIHCRLGDKYKKLKKGPLKPTVMTGEEFEYIEKRCMKLIEQSSDVYFFIACDKPKYKNKLIEFIKQRNKIPIVARENNTDAGAAIMTDMVCLSKCTKIIQWTKYSSYSVCASLLNDVPIVNVYNKDPNHFKEWMPYLNSKLI